MCYSIVLRRIHRCLLHYSSSSLFEVPCPEKCGDWVINFSYDRAEPYQPCQACIDEGLWFENADGDWQKRDKSMTYWAEQTLDAGSWMTESDPEDWEAIRWVPPLEPKDKI